MTDQKSFDWGMVAGVLLMLGANALHWFITPMRHPDATTFQQLATGAQAVVGVGGAIWLITRWRVRRASTPAV
jgi:hypothetical protein